MKKRIDLLERKDEVISWIEQKISKAEMAKRLNCNPKTINPMLKEMGLVYDGNKSGKGYNKDKLRAKKEDYLFNGSTVKSYRLKNFLFKEGIKDKTCESCGLSEWLNQEMPLELHHIDGNSFNNELENLQILCPNCHAMTHNYRGRNKKNIVE